jgi:hypothetical protein
LLRKSKINAVGVSWLEEVIVFKNLFWNPYQSKNRCRTCCTDPAIQPGLSMLHQRRQVYLPAKSGLKNHSHTEEENLY